jgi:hypothetical protein
LLRSALAHRRAAALVLVAMAGLGIRLWVALRGKGSNDIFLWLGFAKNIADHGVLWTWKNVPLYNHPPLIGYFAELALAIQAHLRIRFDFAFKILPLLADVLSGYLIYRIWERRSGRGLLALTAFAFCLDSILVTGYHGNTDSAVIACLLLAACMCDERSFLAAGVALGLSLNIKVIPILCVPLLAARAESRRDLLRFAGGLAIPCLPFLYFAVTAGPLLWRKVFAYNSVANHWGLYALLDLTTRARNVGGFVRGWIAPFREYGRLLPILAALAFAVVGFLDRRRRRWTAVELVAAVMATFLVLTPGFGVQYTIYAVAPLLAVSLGVGFAYGTFAGLFVLLIYADFYNGQHPYFSWFNGPYTIAALPFGAMAWLLLVQGVMALVRRRRPSLAA